MKADWNGYSAELDKLIEDVEPIPASYKFFVECTCSIQKTHTKRMSNRIESKRLYEAYKCKYLGSPFDDGTTESGNTLIDKMTEEKGRDGRKSSRPPI